MRATQRRQAPGVKNGRVQKKNNWDVSPDYYSHELRELVIDRQRPGAGYRHVLMQRDVERFIQILPDWAEMSVGLDAIVLAPGESGIWGWHSSGVVHVCAWRESWDVCYDFDSEFLARDRFLLELIGVPIETEDDLLWARFDFNKARAFSLLATFLHEMGHHHDRITTKSQKSVARGEPYAEAYERKYGDLVWQRFVKNFPID